MSWNYGESQKRVREHLDGIGEIEIEPLKREMDLENLSETVCRQIFAAHIYCQIRNLSELIATLTSETDRKRVVQAVHVYQREVNRIIDAVGGVRIHFQGGRVHALVYRPIRDTKAIASKAVLMQIILDRFGTLFSAEFAVLPDLDLRSGADIGEAIGTRNGSHGDRELLFLGSPANHAAKLLEAGSDRRLTASVREALPDDLEELVETDPEGEYRLQRADRDKVAELLKKYEIEWDEDESAQRLKDDRVAFPQNKALLSGAEKKIDFDELSFFNSKLVEGATLFGDVSGFTAYIDGAKTQSEQKKALRAFHGIRLETARVVKDDFEGVRVQFQGDRVQALFHLPDHDADGVCEEAVRAAIGLQSSFELVLKEELEGIDDLGIAVGVSQGTTMATNLGERGHRDRICLGADVLRAERNEESVGRREIGISGNTREHLPDDLAAHFKWVAAKNCYVAKDLDQKKLDLAETGKALRVGKIYIGSGAVPVIGSRPEHGREHRPAPSHGE